MEYTHTMRVTTTLEQQNHSCGMSPYNGSNNNLRTTESPHTMGVTTTLEQQNHSTGMSPTIGVTTTLQQIHST